ncbi:hypothetical protein LEP1GSC005_1141 [Leptospira santarosai str. ST188]|nr:hypothetical protein LEP1GSC005_1141 [Leptospira santarosai str. ST188]
MSQLHKLSIDRIEFHLQTSNNATNLKNRIKSSCKSGM